MLTATCPSCERQVRDVPDGLAGSTLRCKTCSADIVVPSASLSNPGVRLSRTASSTAPACPSLRVDGTSRVDPARRKPTQRAPKATETATAPKSASSEDPSVEVATIEVRVASDDVRRFADDRGLERLRQHILDGDFARTTSARLLTPPAEAGQPGQTGPWCRLEDVCCGQEKLRPLYEPVWASALKGMSIGVMIGITLKLIDTSIVFAMIDPGLFGFWLLVVGSLFVTRWFALAPLVLVGIGMAAGIPVGGLYLAVLAAALVGSAFGVPAGLVLGTVVGWLRRSPDRMAPDAESEGSKPLVGGFLAPAAFLAFLIPFYFFVVTPWLIGMLGE